MPSSGEADGRTRVDCCDGCGGSHAAAIWSRFAGTAGSPNLINKSRPKATHQIAFHRQVALLNKLTGPMRIVLPAVSSLKIKARPCHLAGAISRQTRFANIWSHGVDRARRRNTDVSCEGGTAIAVASHPTLLVIHVYTGNFTKTKLAFQCEPRPFRRERAARAAGST